MLSMGGVVVDKFMLPAAEEKNRKGIKSTRLGTCQKLKSISPYRHTLRLI